MYVHCKSNTSHLYVLPLLFNAVSKETKSGKKVINNYVIAYFDVCVGKDGMRCQNFLTVVEIVRHYGTVKHMCCRVPNFTSSRDCLE